MIYSVNESTTNKIALFGQDADNFLESVGVALYENTVAIGENVYDGAEAEEFLAENGIFLYEDHIVLEGKQAEEYKARKAKERDERISAEAKREHHRIFNKDVGRTGRNDSERSEKVNEILKKETDRRYKEFLKNPSRKKEREYTNIDDASLDDPINRHIRRHPKQFKESTFFDFDLK